MTGIEIGADSCVLVDVYRRGNLPHVSAVHVVEPPEWPAKRLSSVRRSKRFSHRAIVVAWRSDEAMLQMLQQAGFSIESVISPEKALLMVAAERSRPGARTATAWVALSRCGAALAIIRGTDLLYARRIHWRYRKATRPNEQLLQRYTLVAHLAPELQHGISRVRQDRGVPVDSVVTCGDLPELRSLTMALIEEMDIEAETLDSVDGLDLMPSALAHRAADHASALWLAAAATALVPAEPPRRRWWGHQTHSGRQGLPSV